MHLLIRRGFGSIRLRDIPLTLATSNPKIREVSLGISAHFDTSSF